MKKQRVAITGLGVVSPLGNNVKHFWQQLLAGQSGIDTITKFDASGFPTRFAAEVKQFELPAALKTKHHRYATDFTQFALMAAYEAMKDAELPAMDSSRLGISLGSGMLTSDYDYLSRFQQTCAKEGEISWAALQESDASRSFFQVADFAKTTANTGLSLLIEQFNIKGYANCVHTACASGGQALGLALQVIRRGDAEVMLAGGFDSMISPFGLTSFCLLGALSTYNDTPQSASRPFDRTRNGFVLGEGAAFLVLEAWERAEARGATIYAELAGEGNTLSSYRITDSPPDGEGARQAIEMALKDGQVCASEVDYINAHGTSTKMNDLSETNAIKAAFKEQAYQIPVSACKSQTGHLIAAAGALEAVICALAIKEGKIPMTANLTQADPECDLDYVTEGPREKSLGVVLSNSFGFGGSNSCLLFKHPLFKSHHE